MPRKTKEQSKEQEQTNKKDTKKSTKKATRSSTTKKTSNKTTSSTRAKKTSTTATTKNEIKKNKTATKSKKSTPKTKSKISNKKIANKIENVEYYDLPYRYNQTVVKLLAQTPTNLFIYWDISDEDRIKFQEKYGENFFETTKPVLIIHNDTMGYSFEVEINDFANSWYLHVNDSKCDYRVELGRRPIEKTEKLHDEYIYVSSSNEIESPNDIILFDKNQKMVYFKNVKTGIQSSKELKSISFIKNMGKVYDIYDLYKNIYKSENVKKIYDGSNPSS